MKKEDISFKEKIILQIEVFKNLNPKEMYSWPILAKSSVGVAIFLITLIIGYFTVLLGEQDDLSVSIQKEETLKKSYIDKKRKAINLDLFKGQLDEIQKTSDELLKQLPDKSQIEKLLIDINQAGTGRGLQFDYFKPDDEKILDFYAELPIRLKVVGNYSAIGNFVSDVSKLSRVVLTKDMTITPLKDDIISLETTAKTFRSLDADESQKKKDTKGVNKK